ncbi:unnamed protein product [Gadus morhua 'NCC']
MYCVDVGNRADAGQWQKSTCTDPDSKRKTAGPGPPLDPVGAPLDPFGAPLDPVGAPLDPFGAPLDPFGAQRDQVLPWARSELSWTVGLPGPGRS